MSNMSKGEEYLKGKPPRETKQQSNRRFFKMKKETENNAAQEQEQEPKHYNFSRWHEACIRCHDGLKCDHMEIATCWLCPNCLP